MPTVGVTGHMNLTPPTVSLVRRAIHDTLDTLGEEVSGVSCLAAGADSIFAEEVIARGGKLIAVVPAADYRHNKVTEEHAPTFDALIEQAAEIRILPFQTANRDAYAAANEELLRTVDVLFAVWDGVPGADVGSTSALVAQARRQGVAVRVVWPEGAERRR